MGAPNDIMKSTYSLPSMSQTWEPLAAVDHDRTGRVDGRAARGRVHAFDQRLLGAGEYRSVCDVVMRSTAAKPFEADVRHAGLLMTNQYR